MTARNIAFVLAAACLVPTQAFAWGASGHRMIGELGARSLPDEIPAFVRTPESVTFIGELAREPDRWRDSGLVHDRERDPGHFVDATDDGHVYEGGPLLTALPPTREDYDTAVRATTKPGATDPKDKHTQYSAGYLPYSIIDGWQQLVRDFAFWRIDVAGEKFAKTDEDRAWFANDRILREGLTVRDLGVWAHYVGDASQPLHASVHYNTWGDYPNPEDFTQKPGLHSRFESAFVHANVTEADIAPLMAPYHDCACAIDVRTANYLMTSLSFVAPTFRLDKVHGFDKPADGAAVNPDAKIFAATRLAAGAAELRDMVVDAWRASGTAKVGYKGAIDVHAVENGDVDTALAEMMGKD